MLKITVFSELCFYSHIRELSQMLSFNYIKKIIVFWNTVLLNKIVTITVVHHDIVLFCLTQFYKWTYFQIWAFLGNICKRFHLLINSLNQGSSFSMNDKWKIEFDWSSVSQEKFGSQLITRLENRQQLFSSPPLIKLQNVY